MMTSGPGRATIGVLLDRLHRKGVMHDPVGKTKSVVLTGARLAESARLFRKLFAKPTPLDEPAARRRQ
jgi:Domain of unknown function (DUF6429)